MRHEGMARGDRMTSRDAVMVGALGAVVIAIRFVLMILGGISPYLWFGSHFIDALLIGPVFMLIASKVRKPGAFLIISLVTGVVFLQATWMILATALVGGIASELCAARGSYRSRPWLVASFACFNLGFLGDFLPLWVTRESYLAYAAQNMSADYVTQLASLISTPTMVAIVASIVVGSVLGGLFGLRMMRRHFDRVPSPGMGPLPTSGRA